MKSFVTATASAIAIATASLVIPSFAVAPALAEAHEEGDEAANVDTAALHALFEMSEAASLKRNPFGAFFRGDFTDADKLGDFSAESYATEREAAQADLAMLAAIDRDALSDLDQIAYDTFEYTRQRTLAATEGEVLKTQLALPIDHFRGLHVFYPRLSAPGALMPFDTPEDYADNVSRHGEAAKIIGQAIERFQTGAAEGITLPRLSVEIMVQQLDTQLGAPPEANPYFAPLAAIPESFSEDEAATAREELAEAVTGTLFPAMQRLRDYLANDYLPQTRETIAATANPGGEAYYGYRITEMTTLDLTADEIHEIGLSEVARINAALAEAREEAGDRRAPTYTTKADLQAAWYEVAERVDPLMSQLFLNMPETPLQIEPYEPYREQFSLAASYFPGKADGTRPGTFYFSGYNVAERQLGTSVALYMHEGNPGHHFENMISIENEDLPDFIRYGGFTAFGEGWGLYAEYLGYELGLYDDPVDRIGALAGGELLRAVRLVVDTGMHAKGWSREEAIEYMVANGQARDFATTETARYIVMPAQALAYKLGELKIKELRARATAALGDDFDVREFHDQVLSSGNIPLPVLERKIDDWIASESAGG
jgi:uncharacterized protein (DUF885 family)